MNWEAVFSMRSVRQLHDTIEELFGEVFSVRSMPRCYKQDISTVELVMRLSPASKEVNMEVVGSTAWETITRQQLVKDSRLRSSVRAAVKC
jgi:hypothetical protein